MRIGLFGSVGLPNLGDEAILEKNIEFYRNLYGEDVEFTIFTKNSNYTTLQFINTPIKIVSLDFLNELTKINNYSYESLKKNVEFLLDNYQYENVDTELLLLKRSLKYIFSDLDYLHLIGGGYISEKWPDMCVEVWGIIQLAKKYGIKYFFTGISIDTLSKFEEQLLFDCFDNAEFIDMRSPLPENISYANSKLLVTCDDAIDVSLANKTYKLDKYCNILLHNWTGYSEIVEEKIKKEIIPFLVNEIENKKLDYINLLSFSAGDFSSWNNIIFPPEISDRINYINCLEKGVSKTREIISGAKYNISSRFHANVFSLSSHVPIVGIYYDNYYYEKIKSIHEAFSSHMIFSIEGISKDNLLKFSEDLDTWRRTINKVEIESKLLIKHERIKQILSLNTERANGISVSIIIPVYNMAAYLSQCLNSVINQTLESIEVICINDGSTDHSQDILDEFAWKDKRVKVIKKVNEGVAIARNIGIDNASGEYLFFLDPDDWLNDNKVLEDLYNAAKRENVLVCGGNFIEHGLNGIIENWYGINSKYKFENNGIYTFGDLQFDYGWVRFIYNRKFLLMNKLYIPNQKFFEDPLFFVEVMSQVDKFYGLNRPVYCYRSGHHSYDLSEEKVLDLLLGINSILAIAKDKDYNELIELEKHRLTKDYAFQIVKYLGNHNNPNIKETLNNINLLLYDGNNDRIEYYIFDTVVKHQEYLIWLSKNNMKWTVPFKGFFKKSLKRILPNFLIEYLRRVRG